MPIPPKVVKLIHSQETVTSALAADPSKTAGSVAEKLYGKIAVTEEPKELEDKSKIIIGGTKDSTYVPTKEDLDRTAECGNFKERPSDLFLKMYHDALQTLEDNPLMGVVSPPVMASRGVVPVTIISVIPDIMQHYYDIIVEAKTEVFLATNYWLNSEATAKIVAAMRELSRRAQERKQKIVFKMMYDRGAAKQFIENHVLVTEKEWLLPQVNLPKREELPGLDFELVNYHRPLLGTFHSKYMVVDRRIAILNSNNIQDMPNMEMMVHMEGPIVDGFYDMALISWDRALTPPLPLLSHPATQRTDPYQFGMDHPLLKCKELLQPETIKKAREGRLDPNASSGAPQQGETEAGQPASGGGGGVNAAQQQPLQQGQASTSGQFQYHHHIMGDATKPLTAKTADYQPHVVHQAHGEVPMALVNRRPYGSPSHSDTFNPQNIAWLAGVKYAQHKIFIQTPDFNAKPMVDAILDAVRRGIECTLYVCIGYNDAGEALPYQGGTNEEVVKGMFAKLKPEEKHNLKFFWYTAVDQPRPINASKKQRNCHIKLMIVDEQVGIEGNGNQDAQSWYHSQEINIMIDSKEICSDWLKGIAEAQNTHLYGRVQDDGIWRDKDGTELPDSTGIHSGPMGLIKGIQGSIARVRGTGGF